MSTVSSAARDETAPNIVVRQPTPPRWAEPKVTAAQVENDCPARLQVIGEEITKQFNEAQEQTKLLDDRMTELANLMAEARELCDEGGFVAFREKFFPNLRKSRVYERLAIATKKKTVEEIKAATRERVAKHRANKAEASVSVTVTEKPEQDEYEAVQVICSAPEQAPEPTKARSSVGRGDEALKGFTTVVCELARMTRNRHPERFAETPVTAEDLARLGKLLTDLAKLKNLEIGQQSSAAALPKSGSLCIEQSVSSEANSALQLGANLGQRHEHV